MLRTPTELAAVPAVYGKLSAAATLPPVVDLRSSGFLPPVGDQRSQPSCVAWAVAYTTATYLSAQISSVAPSAASQQASPADLYAKLQRLRPTACREGTLITDAFDIMIRDKVASLVAAPYSDAVCRAPLDVRQFGLAGYRRIEISNPQGIKSALANNKVLVIGARIYSDFEAFGYGPAKTSVYQIRGAATNGGHAMALVGYDDAKQAYLVMNSWGSEFGDRGYFWMDYQSFNASVAEVYETDGIGSGPVNPTPAPSPTPPASVAITSLIATTQTNPFYNVELIFMNFALTEPLFVTSVAFMYEDVTGLGIPPFQSQSFPVGVWMLQSYVQFWYGLPYRWPPGRYTLVVDGTRQSGQAVRVAGTTLYGTR
ncbi:C1 family peptidase [Massilia sp. PAMC28688]|uniref:C1 family peptidase n=1 Tax=Massilia sp. PAMC28688 TaxID=2861283 RepID=UPI001C62808C|nr:C1 family peptidase [Massilia sp. PAMC28688]QYF91912.1 C1 family peptidase [Massilia sp. PAMC28688]